MPMKNTTELAEGDIVVNYGMRILIDGPATVYPGTSSTDTERYAWPGLVLNADALCAKESPQYDAYIACHLRGQWWEDRVPRPRKDNWPIVGNYHATWCVEESRAMEKINPTTFHIDLIGANGTPFRFEFTPYEGPHGTVRYRDRRYTLSEGEPGYGINHTNENGQACGPVLGPEAFTGGKPGIRGWHEVDAWDIDRITVGIVGIWLQRLDSRLGVTL